MRAVKKAVRLRTLAVVAWAQKVVDMPRAKAPTTPARAEPVIRRTVRLTRARVRAAKKADIRLSL